MSNLDTTVIICCAGMGTRLGIGTTKALLHVDGKSLIIHQLERLSSFDDVRVVVGYQDDKVIETVNSYRKDIMFVFNNRYNSTSPSESRIKGMINSRDYDLSIDGDIMIEPDDFDKLTEIDGEFMAVSDVHSEEPVLVEVENGNARRFSENGKFEWLGVIKVKRERLKNSSGRIEGLLPVPVAFVESRDIDTSDDYDNVVRWAENDYK